MLYLDHNATTSMHLKVQKLLIDLIPKELNPSSIHKQGRFAKNIVEEARKNIGDLVGIDLNSREYDIIFTSSGTESNNLIIKNYYDGDIFISAIEHLSIYNHIKYAPNIKVIKVDSNGIVDLNHLEELLQASILPKKLVSIMLANNESGVIQDIAAISKIVKKYNAKLHSDCVQALGKIPVDVKDFDFCTISSHKIGGGQGSSAIMVKSGNTLSPLIIGGGQEKNMRAGTENVAAIAGFGLISSIIKNEFSERYNKMRNLQTFLEKELGKYKCVKIISKDAERLPNTTLFQVKKSDAQTKLIAFDLQGICVSSGSACSSGKVAESHVLSAMKCEINSSIRVSLSPSNSLEEIKVFIKAFKEVYKQEIQYQEIR